MKRAGIVALPINLEGLHHEQFDARSLATRFFDELRHVTGDGIGITRDSYGPGEQKGLDIVEAFSADLGLDCERDAAANLIISLEGQDPSKSFAACGSHMDSVPQGGNFDGAAGVLAGLLALGRMRAQGIVPPRTIKLLALRGEESPWFGRPYIGSSALFGELSAHDLAARHRTSGQTLKDCMREAGANTDQIEKQEHLLEPKSIAAFIELHIEQGPVLIARDLPTAIVTGIRGNIRHRTITCTGEAGHSGAVPRWLRRDAVFAVADLITRLDEHWRVLLERGLDLVVTTGVMSTDPDQHAVTRIPGEVTFSLDIRSQSTSTLEAFYQLVQTECRAISTERKVRFHFDRRVDAKPARMNPDLVNKLLAITHRMGLPAETIPSGAGHDAAVFANAGIPTTMIFVRNANGSHNPHEAMEIDDFLKGADILFQALLEID
jgi:N-carbamoyl-L-amino-acid hydrolase